MSDMLKSFSKRLRESSSRRKSASKESSQATSNDLIEQPRPTATPVAQEHQKGRNGLILLNGSELTDQADREVFNVDIVAIHGLNGDAYTSWEHENGTLWLRDLLPDVVPGSRIFTYGYPAKLFFSNSVAGVRDYSQRLLSSLNDVLDEDIQRPIIFVCHSLGGIVCKQALILAHEDIERYGNILTATTAIVFLGTPHRGSSGTTDLGKVVGKIINACLYMSKSGGIAGVTRTDLLDTLSADSDALKNIATSFRNRLRNLEIVTFYETEITPPLTQLVVDKPSAIMDVPNEEVIPLFANHLTMCRYAGATREYDAVSKALKRLSRKAHRKREATMMATTESADRSLNETEKSCMILLNSSEVADYRAELPKPVEGTCRWILRHPQFVSWVSKKETTLLWITGDPGCGKTILSSYLSQHLDNAQTTQLYALVCFFFCDDKIITQRDAKAILRNIIYQILRRHRSLIKYVKTVFEIQGSQLVHSFEALWNIFMAITNDHKFGSVSIIVDAIDECEGRTRDRFLKEVAALVQKAGGESNQSLNCIKFLFTSRPSLRISYDFNGFPENRLAIEGGQDGLSEDVRLVIERRVEEIVKRNRCSPRTKEFLETALYSRADQTFLWVMIVLQRLEDSLLASDKDFQRIISTLPQDLAGIYESFLYNVLSAHQDLATKMLHILVGSSRYLALEEINVILTINAGHQTVTDVQADCQPSIGRTIQGVLGPLARITGSKVSLVHQSAKEFLLALASRTENPLASSYGVDQDKAALILATCCISYLLLQDFEVDHFSWECSSSEKSSASSPVFGRSILQIEETPYDPFGLNEDIILRDQHALEVEACQSLVDRYDFFDYSATHWAGHLLSCEQIAPQSLRRAAVRLAEKQSHRLTNWLKYFWCKTGMEQSCPEDFDPLKVAAFFNHSALLNDLLHENQCYDKLDKDRALFWAGRMGGANAAEILLRNEADPNSRAVDRQTPLAVAAQHGHIAAVRILIADERTDLNLKGKSGRSPLSFAAGNAHLDVVRLLLSHGHCKPDEQDDNHWTPLFWAVGGNHVDILSELLNRHGTNINHTDKSGRSAFSWAAGDGLVMPLKYLLKHPHLEPNLQDRKGRNALSWAAGNGHTEVVRALMRHESIDRPSKDLDHRNAISWACAGGHEKALKTLVKYSCPGIDDEDASGWTPLAWALNNRSLATVQTLLSTSLVDIEHRDKNGRTALGWAANYGYSDVVQLLLSEGADARVLDNEGRSPLAHAKAYGHIDVIQELETWLGNLRD